MLSDPRPRPLASDFAMPEGPSALLGHILRQSPIGIAVIDHEGLFVEVNPAYCALYGWTRDQLLGQPFSMIVEPAKRAQVLQRHRAFLDEGAALRGEFNVQRADGRVLCLLIESVRLASTAGQPMRLVYVVDITERRAAEQALQDSQRFLQSVIDGLAAHVCVLDAQGTLLMVNRAWRQFAEANGGAGAQLHEGANYLAVCRRAGLSGQTGTDETSEFLALLDEVLAGRRQHFQLEYPCHSSDEQRWYVVRVSRMASDGPARIVVAHDNVTALKQAQATLRESEALMRDLAASMPGAMFRLVHRPGEGWRFTYFSPGLEALFELTPDEAIADIHALGRCILPEDKPAHDQSVVQAVAEGRGWEHEYRIRTPSGLLKWVQVQANPGTGADGGIVWTGLLRDVSERKRLESVLKASETQYRTLFETVPQGVVYHDAEGRITSANPAAQRILGLSLAQMQGRLSVDPRWQALREDGSDFPGQEHPAMVALRTGQPVNDVVMGVAVPGRGRAWLLVNAMPLFRQGELQEVYASFEDITERVLLGRELQLQASTDFLTGVANRRSLMDRLRLEFDRHTRHPASRCSVLAVDLDHFKQVNDGHGHATGDAVLRQVAHRMQQVTRQNDLVARSGGEEFTLLLPDTGPAEAQALAERLRRHIAGQPVVVDQHAVAQTVSIGLAMIEPGDPGPDAVLARADAALYEAKRAGRNTVRVRHGAA